MTDPNTTLRDTGSEPIPLFDLRLTQSDLDAVAEVLRSGQLAAGERTGAFERAFAKQLGVRHAVSVANGTAALTLAYLAVEVGPGDEVIVPSYTFVATASAARHCGAEPVFADIQGLHNPVLDVEEVQRRITRRTKAIVCVHIAGYPAPVDELVRLCAERGLALIEDAAHAPSAEVHGRKLGAWGKLGAFSLFSNKVLSVGEGGVVVTDDDELAARVRALASGDGSSVRVRGLADVTRWDCRIDEPRGALALSRLPGLQADIAHRRAATRAYRERLAANPALIVPFEDRSVEGSSCYAMLVFVRDPARRDDLRLALRERYGVQTTVLYPPVHRFSAYIRHNRDLRLARTEAAASRVIALPLFAHLRHEQRERVAVALEQELAA